MVYGGVTLLGRWIVKALILRSPARSAYGIGIALADADSDPTSVFEKVESALGMIRIHDPRQFARVRANFRSIVVTRLYRGEQTGIYIRGLDTCFLNPRFVDRYKPLAIALTIVHEATHARLYRAGIRSRNGDVRARVERICLGREIALARKIPDQGELVEILERKRDEAIL